MPKYSADSIYKFLYNEVLEAQKKHNCPMGVLAKAFCGGFLTLATEERMQVENRIELVFRTWRHIVYSDGKISPQELCAFKIFLGKPSAYSAIDFANDLAPYNDCNNKECCYELFKKIKVNKARSYYIKFCIALSLCDGNHNAIEYDFCHHFCQIYDEHN